MGGGEFTEPSPSPQTRVRYQFESFCKKVIYGERCDYFREQAHRAAHESSFSDLPDAFLNRLCAEDADPADQYVFQICGYCIPIRNDHLAESLLTFDRKEYSILLLAYSLELSDRKIGSLLGMSRSKIQRDRQKLLAELEKLMKE